MCVPKEVPNGGYCIYHVKYKRHTKSNTVDGCQNMITTIYDVVMVVVVIGQNERCFSRTPDSWRATGGTPRLTASVTVPYTCCVGCTDYHNSTELIRMQSHSNLIFTHCDTPDL